MMILKFKFVRTFWQVKLASLIKLHENALILTFLQTYYLNIMTTEGIFEILIGTYEEFVLGYQLIKTEDEENKYSLHQTFVTHSHTASVRSLASTPKLAASSGADETVILYDMAKRKQSGALMQQEGTITCLKFTPDGSHLISCSDDGSIAIFRVGSWQLEKLFKNAHKGTAVNHIAVHPSGKLAMSVGRDKTLRTWNLIKGRSAYITNLSSFGVSLENLDLVVWSPEGLLYALPIQTKALVFSVEKGGILHTLVSTCKVHSVCFLNETTVCIGNEESDISAYDISSDATGSPLWSLKATSSRIKALASYDTHLIAITSAGDLVVWNFDEEDLSEEPVRVAATNDACRFTCLTIRPPIVSEKPDDSTPNSAPDKKRKKKKKSKNLSEIAPPTTPNQTKISEQHTPFLNIKSYDTDEEIEVIDVSIGGGSKSDKSGDDVEDVNVSIDGGEKRKERRKGGVKTSESVLGKGKTVDEDNGDEISVKSTKKNLKIIGRGKTVDEDSDDEISVKSKPSCQIIAPAGIRTQ
uniref:p21-activated protein kinase-interacting protein 1-like n=1 Tax=Cacopsylla melanoneura TaxID=428564 RepID=A0A8D8ZIY3_9HEMI